VKTPFIHPAGGIARRTAIQAGTISLLGLGLNHLAALEALATNPSPTPARAKSVIYIFLSGGLAQHESFDPKPDAPSEIRGEFKPIPTRTAGMQICEHLPLLAARSEKWALCRSLTHKSNDHSASHHIMLTGRSDMPVGFDPNKPKESDWPSIASLTSQFLPPANNLPPAIVLPEKLVHSTGRVIPGQFSGILGRKKEPFFLDACPFHPQTYGAFPEYLFHHRDGEKQDSNLAFHSPNLSLPHWLTQNRLEDRVTLVRALDKQKKFLDQAAEVQSFDRHWQMAVSLLADGKISDSLDVTKAPSAIQEKYGRNAFGWSLLLASRLVETGVRLVQVNLGNDETWDTHEAAFPNLKNYLLPPMDRAVSALLDDLESKGLLEDTLIVMASEFGRTPKITTIDGARLPGRDHWGAVQSVFFAGGGVRGGTVIGSSDKNGGYPDSAPQKPENLSATIFKALGIPAKATFLDEQSRPYALYNADPIPGLMS